MSDPYAYRICLMRDQVRTLFGCVPDTLEDFARMSQISQAEAKKYFIERFRVSRGRRNGIIWWSLIDGWPQVSDAVVDYGYTKKLAYHYIKRTQQPVLFAFDEPDGGTAVSGKSHYIADIRGTAYADYLKALRSCGFDEWEGFPEEI